MWLATPWHDHSARGSLHNLTQIYSSTLSPEFLTMTHVNVKRAALALALSVAAVLITPGAVAQTAGAASTGVICKDGSTWAKSGRGACRGHGGVDKHAGSTAAGSAAAPASATTPPATTPTGGAASTPAAPSGQHRSTSNTAAPTIAPAPGGGNGQVWVNSKSKVYHCQGDRWYGKTQQGQYMSEGEAKAQGNRPDHGKSCS